MLSYPSFDPHFPTDQWTLPQVLEYQAERHGDDTFLRWESAGERFTYAQANARVNRLAHGLASQGIGIGDRIVLLMPNSLDFVFLYMAANKLGAVQAPINTAYRGHFLEHQVNICGAETIVVADEFLATVIESLPKMAAIRRVVVWTPPGGVPSDLQPATPSVAMLRFQDLDSGRTDNPTVRVRPQDLSVIIFTSGTTGLSKGVLMTHAQVYLFSEQGAQLMQLTADDTYMTALPLFHGNAQFLSVYCSMIVGCACVLYERFSVSEWVSRLHATGTTVTNMVGAMLAFVNAQPRTDRDGTHKLRRVLSAPTPWELIDTLRERFGITHFQESFGQTEINLTMMTPMGVPRPRGSVGRLASQWYEARLVNPDTDEDVPEGEVGELVVRPRMPWILNQGYANMPEKTVEAWRNLWFHTGDALRRDKDGWFQFLDRYKDTLRRRGENISSYEAEAPLREHPQVKDVAIVAVPAAVDGGEDEVKACIVLKDGAVVSCEELVAWCDERMPYFVVPRFIEFYNVFPTSASEKVQKSVLRAAGVTPGTWDRVAAGVKLRDEVLREEKKRRAKELAS